MIQSCQLLKFCFIFLLSLIFSELSQCRFSIKLLSFSVLPVFSSRPSSSVSVPSIRGPLRARCSAKGSPLPTVTWYKNNVSMPVINNVTADEFTSELVIGEFQSADQDTYKCVAQNVYNNTVETSTRICKSRTVLMQISSPAVVKHFFLHKLEVHKIKIRRNVSIVCPSWRCYLRFFLLYA